QWYSNTTNSNIGGSQVAGQTSSTYTPATTSVGTFYYYVTITGGCGAPVPSSVAVIIIGGNSWAGTIDADWNKAGNWCSGVVPDITTDVIIPVVSNLPKLFAADGFAHNLTIASGASLDLGGYTLTLAGTF